MMMSGYCVIAVHGTAFRTVATAAVRVGITLGSRIKL